MNNDFVQTYEAKLEAQKNQVLNSKITQLLELKKLSNKKLDRLYEQMKEITDKPVYEQFNFRSGKLIGILQHIFQNPKKRKELFALTGLSQAHIDLYYEVMGNLPFVNTKTNTLNMGRPMVCEDAKELLQAVGVTLGVLVDEKDLLDINEENWNRLYNNALIDAKKTIEFNESNAVAAGGYEE